MRQLLLTRLLSAAPILLAVALLTFLLTRLTSTDPVVPILGPGASTEDRAEYAHKLGLDLPLWEQFLRWLAAAVRGDLGVSQYTALPVAPTLADGVSVTLTLALPKTGLLVQAAREVAGELAVADIGVPPAAYARIGVHVEPLFAAAEFVRVDGQT